MAGRTSSSLGVGITVTILGIATLGLFVASLIFFSQKNAAQRSLTEARENAKDYIGETERSREDVQQMLNAARKDKKSLVRFLLDSTQETMAKTTGSKQDTYETLTNKLKTYSDAETSNMLAMIRDREQTIQTLTSRVNEATAARDRALADRENEAKRVAEIEAGNRTTIAGLNNDINKYKDEVDRLRDQINEYRAQLEKRAEEIRTSAEGVEADLRRQLDDAQKKAVLDRERIAQLEVGMKGQRFTGQAEYSIVDGQIIGLDAVDRTVFINLGRKDRITLGMTFEVYTDATALRPDGDGNLPAGKASIEVIKIDNDTSVCRILREKKGSPVIRGDVIVNGVYDPKKTYKFVVFGNFDANRDGRFTPQEATDVRAKIAAWRGQVVDELSGDVDFVVLGERPILPPEPSRNAPVEVLQEYIRLKQIRDRYDELLQRGTEAAIPILNLNRLDTLTGGGL